MITFIMQVENLDYLSALELLCKRVGMEMPHDDDKSSELLRRSRIFEMNKEAARFFNASLNTDEAEEARQYISKRGLSTAAVKHFGLGYAPRSFDALRKHMNSLGYKDAELKEAFLSGLSAKTGRYFDYFRGRLMFPIIDNFGNVIAFGGRSLDDSMPKYLNTSDTPAFKKSRNLFALNFARRSDKGYMILCEGYMDVISMHMAGFTNAVATLGTALTSEQARILAKYTKKVILSYDSDEAGVNATRRAMPMLADAGLEVRVLKISGAKDPDEYIKKYGSDKFKLLVEGSSSKLDFLCDSVMKKYNILLPEEKIKAANELCEAASRIHSDVEREIYIDRISEKLDIDRKNVRSDVERLRRYDQKREQGELSRRVLSETLGYSDRINRDRSANIKAAKAEEAILGIMLLYPETVAMIKSGKIALCADDFVTEFNKRVFSALISDEGGADIGVLAGMFSVEEIARIQSMAETRAALSDNGERVLCESIDALRREKDRESIGGDDISAAMALLKNKK